MLLLNLAPSDGAAETQAAPLRTRQGREVLGSCGTIYRPPSHKILEYYLNAGDILSPSIRTLHGRVMASFQHATTVSGPTAWHRTQAPVEFRQSTRSWSL